jgi:hypothetical protein
MPERPDSEQVAAGLRSLADQIASGATSDRILFAAQRFLELAAQYDGSPDA